MVRQKTLVVFVVLCLLFGLFAGLPTMVDEAEGQLNVLTRFDYYTPGGAVGVAMSDTYQGQTFTASATYNATIFSIYLQTNGAPFPDSTTFYLFNVGVDGLPSSQIFSRSISFSGFSGGWYNVSITNGVVLTAGNKYFIGIHYGQFSNQVRMWYISAGTYDGGMRVTGSSLPPTNGVPGADCVFQVFGYHVVAVGTYSYTFVGPRYEGDPQGSSTAFITLTGVDGSVNQISVASGTSYTWTMPLVSASWNFSSVLNLTRTIEFLPSDGTAGGMRVFQLFTASPDYVMGVYLFNVVDYTGKANFVEVSLGGVVVERRSLSLSGSADFSLYKGLTYSLNVVSLSSGVYRQLFTAGNVYSTNVILLANSFGESPLGDGLVDMFSAVRRSDNGSVVSLFFDSPDNRGWFNFSVYVLAGRDRVQVYNGSVLCALLPLNFVFEGAVLSSEYVVEGFRFDVSGSLVRSWSVIIPAVGASSGSGGGNPFGGLLEPFFAGVATFPGSAVLPTGFDVAQVPYALIIALVLAIFSWQSHGMGCILAWVVAVVGVALGWFVVSLPAFGFALFLSVFIVVVEGKRTEREL